MRQQPQWPDQPVTVRVPATSANLGPGFDALGLALSLYDTAQARITSGGLAIGVSGAGEESAAAGEKHLVLRAMRAGFDALGVQPPGISLRCENAIPQGFGLGSSAAAIVAGLLAARALGAAAAGAAAAVDTVFDDSAVLRLATEMEGHPDNVAACLAGGLTIAWTPPGGVSCARLSPLPGLAPVLCIPQVPVATEVARQALPPTVPHADAAANAARAALLIAALTQDPALLMAGTEDFLHQPYRAGAMPASAALIARLRGAGIPAVMSGAGPAVLALIVPGRTPGADEAAAIAGAARWRALPLTVDRAGATLLPG